MDTSPVAPLEHAVGLTASLVAGVAPGQWDAPTPCTEWTVRELVVHVIRGQLQVARALETASAAASGGADDRPADDEPAVDRPADDEPSDDRPADDRPTDDRPAADRPADVDRDLADDELAGAWRTSGREMVAAFAVPGALGRVVQVPFGAVPGAVALQLRLVEVLVHGWDLARATGGELTVPDELVAGAAAFTRRALADLPPDRSPFGSPRPVPDDAPALDQLAGLLGRDVGTALT